MSIDRTVVSNLRLEVCRSVTIFVQRWEALFVPSKSRADVAGQFIMTPCIQVQCLDSRLLNIKCHLHCCCRECICFLVCSVCVRNKAGMQSINPHDVRKFLVIKCCTHAFIIFYEGKWICWNRVQPVIKDSKPYDSVLVVSGSPPLWYLYDFLLWPHELEPLCIELNQTGILLAPKCFIYWSHTSTLAAFNT